MKLNRWKSILQLVGIGYLALCGGALYLDYKLKERKRRKEEDSRLRGNDRERP